jgi:hypothetical protein
VRSGNSIESLLNTGSRVGPEFDPAKLQRIVANLTRGERVTVEIGTEAAMRQLERSGADAAYMAQEGGGILLLKPNATRLEVIEELMHIGQHRATGWAGSGGDALRRLRWELDAQPRLIDLAKRQNWTTTEIDKVRENYLRWLEELPGANQ